MTVGTVRTAQGRDIGPQINALAAREQCDTRGVVALLIAESGLDERARRPVDPTDDATFWEDVSGGVGQQTVKYAAAFGLGDGSPSRANIDAVMAVLMTDVDRALDIAAQQYGAFYRQTGSFYASVAKYNGGAGASWASIPAANRANYERGWAAAAEYEMPEPPAPRTYDPDYGTPPWPQRNPWTCAICATAWALGSLGYALTPADLQDPMVQAGVELPGVGLAYATGAGLEQWLRDTYGLATERADPADWDWVQARAGAGPVLIGGRAWEHWVAVRRASAADQLALANSAAGWMGVGQTLGRADWDRLGAFAAIALPVAAPAPPPDPPPTPDPAPVDDWEARWGALESLRGYLQGDVCQALSDALARARAAKNASARAEAFADLAGAIQTLRSAGK